MSLIHPKHKPRSIHGTRPTNLVIQVIVGASAGVIGGAGLDTLGGIVLQVNFKRPRKCNGRQDANDRGQDEHESNHDPGEVACEHGVQNDWNNAHTHKQIENHDNRSAVDWPTQMTQRAQLRCHAQCRAHSAESKSITDLIG